MSANTFNNYVKKNVFLRDVFVKSSTFLIWCFYLMNCILKNPLADMPCSTYMKMFLQKFIWAGMVWNNISSEHTPVIEDMQDMTSTYWRYNIGKLSYRYRYLALCKWVKWTLCLAISYVVNVVIDGIDYFTRYHWFLLTFTWLFIYNSFLYHTFTNFTNL